MTRRFKETEIGKIPEDWEIEKVDDIKADEKRSIISGPFGSNIGSRFFVDRGIPVIRGNNLTEKMDKFIDEGFVFLTKEKAEELGTWAKREDIIFTAAGTIGQVGMIPKNSRYEEYIISNKQLRLRVNPIKILPIFAFYWFSSPLMVSYIKQRNTGSTIPLINLSVLKNLPIVKPNIAEQSAIAKILSDLDSKIELNQQMNKTLEATGQVLFKHWFVDFEFPDEKGKPYKSSGGEVIDSELGKIPKGWRVGNVGGLISVQGGFAFKGEDFSDEGEIGIIKIKNITPGLVDVENTQYVLRESVINLDKKFNITSGSILIAMTGAEVAKIGIVPKTKKELWLNQRVGMFKENVEKSLFYSYLLLSSQRYQELLKNKAYGSAQPNISSSDIESVKILVPSRDTIKKFGILCEPIFMKVINNMYDGKTLSQIRDSLLPKLMSGKIRVPIEVKT